MIGSPFLHMPDNVRTSDRLHDLSEMIATILMAVATVATAWCAYQSTVWDGEQEFALHEANILNESVDAHREQARIQMMIHIEQFISWAEAIASENERMASYMESTFAPSLRTAVDEWRALDPLNDLSAPRHPFALPSYVLEDNVKADSLQVLYRTQYQTAIESNTHSEHYTLLTVILASVLFFGGITTNLTHARTKISLVVGSAILLIASVIWPLSFPMIIR
jgi:hypothetical protein